MSKATAAILEALDALRMVAIAQLSAGPSVAGGAWRELHDAIARLMGGTPAGHAQPQEPLPSVILPAQYRHLAKPRTITAPVAIHAPAPNSAPLELELVQDSHTELVSVAAVEDAGPEPAAEPAAAPPMVEVLRALKLVARAEAGHSGPAVYAWRRVHDELANALGEEPAPQAVPVRGRQPAVMPPAPRAPHLPGAAAAPADGRAAVPVTPTPPADIRQREDVAAEIARVMGRTKP